MTYEDYYDNLLKYQQKYTSDYQLLDELFENGYDIVYVDFAQGTGDIIKNAEVLAEAIKWVNGEKAANGSTEQNVVVGYSMGGLIARLGIRYLELDPNENPDVSYYISVDAPHLGANVPLGLRFAIEDLYENVSLVSENLGEYEQDLQDAYDVLHSPAARQMLLYSFDSFFINNWMIYWDNTTRTNFWNELDGKGMPTSTIQNIAIAKGNGAGQIQHFGSLDPLFNADVQNNYDCFDDLVDIFNLVNSGSNNGVVQTLEKVLNLYLGYVISLTTLLGDRADFELDVNAMPGHVDIFYQIYERRLQFRILWIVPVGGSHMKIKIKDAYPYDSSPGSTYSVENFAISGGDFGPLLNGDFAPCIELHEQDFCFIPTFSALNVISLVTSPYSQIDPEEIVTNNKTPFDKCYILDPTMYQPNTAPTNESHISFSPSNINPFEEYISPDFNAVNENPTVHGYTFNFGYAKVGNVVTKTTDRITRPLTVSGISSANGALWINRADNLENINNTNNPVSTSTDFSVELTRSCDYDYGRITIEEFGSIVIGENQQKKGEVIVRNNSWIKMNDGFIEVRDGSKLIIENGGVLRLNGGVLRIQDGGEVIIKSGGKLIYEKDTQIELNGNDAVLSLGGLTHIGDDATFTFTYQGGESGYIRMLKEGYWGQRFSAGVNAKVELKGKDKDDLILYMEEGVDFWEFSESNPIPGESYTSHKFIDVKFTKGKIIMEEGARIVLLSKSRFMHTTVEALNPSHKPRGIVPFTFCYIISSTLNRMSIDALLHYYESGFLSIEESTLNHSFVAVRGYGYQIRSSDFYFSSIGSEFSTIVNTIYHSTFRHAPNVAVTDWSPTELNVYNTVFRQNKVGIFKSNGRVTAKCSDFIQNDIGIWATNGSEVNMSTLYNGGYNHFAQNDYNIQLFEASGLQLEDGYNELYAGNIMNIEGTLDLSSNPCPPDIIAHNNTWTPSNLGGPFNPAHPHWNQFDVSIQLFPGMPHPNVVCQMGFRFDPVAPITPCGKYDDPRDPWESGDPGKPIDNPIEGPKSLTAQNEFPLINSPVYYTDIPFNIAMKMAAFNTTVADTISGNDLIAADMFYELLYLAQIDSNTTDSMDVVIENMRWGSLNNYKATIERLFADSVLLRSNNQNSFDPTIENYVGVLMHFTDSIKTDENYKRQFQLEIWKSSLMRTIGKAQQALQIVTNINYCDHDSLQRIILLEQIQGLEFDLMRSQLDITTFLTDSVTFVVDSTIYEIPFENYISTTGFGSYIQSPNSILFSACNTAMAKPSPSSLHNLDIDVVIYPNPAQNYLNISFLNGNLSSEAILTLRIYELTGKEVFNAKLTPQNVRLDLPDLANALYLYRLEMEDKLIDQGKISIIE